MAVETYEKILRWAEFEGTRQFLWGNGEDKEDFFMTIEPGTKKSSREMCLFGHGHFISDTPSFDEMIELEVPATLFARCLRRVLEAEPLREVSLNGNGRFKKLEDGRIRYTTECGQEYDFEADDMRALLELI